ncbi:MAG: hypothetical protein SX243_08200 [Acidobacteriota bacterium]|nr:hypothetical protein [Acidobacteriota bacterium]
MKQLFPTARFLGGACFFLLTLCLGMSTEGEITLNADLSIRILLDNSASMYPGYQPPGTPHASLAQSGGRFFAQYPEFGSWLDDFVKAQTVLGGSEVSLATFTSGHAFSPGDVRTLQPSVPLTSFRFQRLVDKLPRQGLQTYISESLEVGTRGFEGIVWLITDNIVEERRGVPDEGVQRFFRQLAGTERYRAVHLYKLSFDRLVANKQGSLAVYGILISKQEVSPAVLRYYDNKFRSALLEARRAGGGALFPDRAYWKLKDLSFGALELELKPKLDVEIVQQEHRLFRERQIVKLILRGSVSSRLTQHRVVGGEFTLLPEGDFRPVGEAEEDFGLEPIPPEFFDPHHARLQPIAPRKWTPLQATLTSNRAIPLETRGLSAWFRSASRGLTVPYKGQVVARFSNLEAIFDRSQMDGIFGADAAPEIFGIQQRIRIPSEVSNPEPVAFELTTGYGRMLLFALLFLVLLGIVGLLFWFFADRRSYRVLIAGEETILSLRRLTFTNIQFRGHALGRLRRGMTDPGRFEPNQSSAAVSVQPSRSEGRYDIILRKPDQQVLEVLEILHVGGGPVQHKTQEPPRPGPPGGSPDSPSPARQPSVASKIDSSSIRRPTISRP